MLFDFFNFLHNNDLNEYLDCYSNFLISRNEPMNKILNIRKNILIDTYAKNNNKFYYNNYYLINFNDNLKNKKLIHHVNIFSNNDHDDDDIDDHYKLMFIKNPEKKIIDYDELDKKYIENEIKKEEENKYDIFAEFSDDYYEDDDDELDDINYYEDDESYYDEYY